MENNKLTQKNKRIGSKIALVVGALIIISSSVSGASGNSVSFVTGLLLILGTLAYLARRNQNEHSSTKWKITEIISILIILYFVFMGIISGGWYSNPIPFLITPLLIAVAYIIAFRGGEKNKSL